MKQIAQTTSTRNLSHGVIALAAATLALTGCGGGSGSAGPIAGLQTTPSTPTTQSTPETPSAPIGNTGDLALDAYAGDSTLVKAVPAFTYAATSEEYKALTSLNAARVACGFGALKQVATLDVAAAGHAKYLLFNNYAGHYQDSSKPFFTGNGPADRATAAGYNWSIIMDDNADTIGTGANDLTDRGPKSVKSLLSAPYHAASLLSPMLDVGTSVMSSDTAGSTGTYGPRAIAQFNIGLTQGSITQKPNGAYVATFPCDDTVGTAYQLTNESPNPIPGRDLSVNPIGQPIIVAVRSGQIINITSASMVKKSDGTAVALRPVMTMDNDPNGMISFSNAVILPDAPLLPNTEYTVTISGTNTTATIVGGGVVTSSGTNPAITSNSTGAFTKTFSFTTGP